MNAYHANDAVVCDLDDYCNQHAGWALPILDRMYAQSDCRFRVTLFVIPSKTSPATLDEAAKRPYIECAVHGWDHHMRECEDWDRHRTMSVLDQCPAPYVHVFKAPYWVASRGVYEGLQEADWAVADHPQNRAAIPRGVRAYILSPAHGIGVPHHVLPIIQAHGHFTNEAGNGLRENLGRFVALASSGREFKFVSEVVS